MAKQLNSTEQLKQQHKEYQTKNKSTNKSFEVGKLYRATDDFWKFIGPEGMDIFWGQSRVFLVIEEWYDNSMEGLPKAMVNVLCDGEIHKLRNSQVNDAGRMLVFPNEVYASNFESI